MLVHRLIQGRSEFSCELYRALHGSTVAPHGSRKCLKEIRLLTIFKSLSCGTT